MSVPPSSSPAGRPPRSALAVRRPAMRRWWRRRVLAHRRLLAALCASVAVGAVLLALQPDAPSVRSVPVAARDLPAGRVLESRDLVLADVPTELVPTGVVPAPTGRALASPLRRGEIVTDARLISPGLLSDYPGLVGVSVRVPDAAVVLLLRPGDMVDIVTTDPRSREARVVARGATVIALPPDPGGAAGAGAPAGRAVLLGVRPEELSPLTAATVSGFISVVFDH